MVHSISTVFRQSIESIVNPFSCLLILLCVSIFWSYKHAHYLRWRKGFFCVLIGILIFSTSWLPRWMAYQLQKQYPVVATPDPRVHWIVVLGGGQKEYEKNLTIPTNHLLNYATVSRLLEGVRLYRKIPGATLILSGGSKYLDASRSEAAHMAELTRWFKIPSHAILLEKTSFNTVDEIIAIKAWIKQEPFYLVTSAIHMPRAMALCKKQGLHPLAAPADYPYDWQYQSWSRHWQPSPFNLVITNNVWHEFAGRMYERVRGQV